MNLQCLTHNLNQPVFWQKGPKIMASFKLYAQKIAFFPACGWMLNPSLIAGKDSALHCFTAQSVSSPEGTSYFVPSHCGCRRYCRSQFALGHPTDIKPSPISRLQDLTVWVWLWVHWVFRGMNAGLENTLMSWVLAKDACNYWDAFPLRQWRTAP